MLDNKWGERIKQIEKEGYVMRKRLAKKTKIKAGGGETAIG